MTDVVAGRFALCDPIASGGSGTVWRAYDRKLGAFCAAKVLRRRDAGELLRFVREQSVRLAHPNVLTPYSWAAEDTHVVIASELVDGGTLRTLLGDYGPLAEGTVAAVLDQLLQALEHVHGAGLVHRDVKPGNVLLHATGDGPLHLRLSDFGLAIRDDDAHLTDVGTVLGTPAYLAPELLRGGVAPDARHDLFAVGKVAAALAAGAEPPPRVGPPDLSAVPAGPLRDLVAALTAEDPRARPGSATQARERLRAVPIDETPRAGDGTPVEVLHQLPELSSQAQAEAGVPPTVRLDTREPLPTAPLPTPRPGPRRRRPSSRRALLTGAAAAAVVAVGTPVGLAVASAHDGKTPQRTGTSTPGSTVRSTVPSTSPPASPAQSSAPVVQQLVRIGSTCTFLDQGNTAKATDGTQATCVLQPDGRYVWQRS